MEKNKSKELHTLSQMGLQSYYQDAIMLYFNGKFQNPSSWYALLKQISRVKKISLVEAWYNILYVLLL